MNIFCRTKLVWGNIFFQCGHNVKHLEPISWTIFILLRFAARHREEDGAILVRMFWCQMPNYFLTTLSGVSQRQKIILKKICEQFRFQIRFRKTLTKDNTWNKSKVILEDFRSVPIAEQCANTFRMDWLHPSCWISVWLHDLVIEGGHFPGGLGVQSGRQTCFFTAVDPENVPLKTHRFEANQPTHNEVHWFALKFVQEQKWVFRQTITSAIIPH